MAGRSDVHRLRARPQSQEDVSGSRPGVRLHGGAKPEPFPPGFHRLDSSLRSSPPLCGVQRGLVLVLDDTGGSVGRDRPGARHGDSGFHSHGACVPEGEQGSGGGVGREAAGTSARDDGQCQEGKARLDGRDRPPPDHTGHDGRGRVLKVPAVIVHLVAQARAGSGLELWKGASRS